jgi:hypothetical protein
MTSAFVVVFIYYMAIFSGYRISIVTTSFWSFSPLDYSGAAAPDNIDWSKFAYIQYATNSDCLCNSVMLFEALKRLGSRADRVLMYPEDMMPDTEPKEPMTDNQRLLRKAADLYKVHLVPIQVQHRDGQDGRAVPRIQNRRLIQADTWADSFTKLLAFNQTQYTRVLSLDSDATILQAMDELFLLPDCPLALPRAYWLLPDSVLSSQVLLIKPDEYEFRRVYEAVGKASENEYDMDIINKLYKDTAMILPHRPYDLLTGEFRNTGSHSHYLGNHHEEWDPVAHFSEAKFIHFSDWPVPKPWLYMSDRVRDENQPSCRQVNGVMDCVQRDMWNSFYTDFKERREVSSSSHKHSFDILTWGSECVTYEHERNYRVELMSR